MSYEEWEEYAEYNPEDFLEDYEVNLREVITKAVNDKIKTTIESLNNLKIENEALKMANSESRRKLNSLESQHKKDLERHIKETENEVERKFCGGFAINDDVYYLDHKTENSKCEKCGGIGKVELEVLGKLTKVNCPHCNYGTIHNRTYFPKKDKISYVKFSISRRNYGDTKPNSIVTHIEYGLDGKENLASAEGLYKTLDECQVYCDKKNTETSDKKL